jgi:hypothetical protein
MIGHGESKTQMVDPLAAHWFQAVGSKYVNVLLDWALGMLVVVATSISLFWMWISLEYIPCKNKPKI